MERDRPAIGAAVTRIGGAEGVSMIVALVRTIFVAKWLGPESFGVAALILATPALVFTVFDPRSSECVVHYLATYLSTRQLDKARALVALLLRADVLVGLVGVAVMAAAGGWAETHIVKSSGVVWLLVLVSVALVASAVGATARAVLTAVDRFAEAARIRVGMSLARSAVTLVVVGAGGGVEGFILTQAAFMVLEAAVFLAAAATALRRTAGGSWSDAPLGSLGTDRREILRFLVITDLTGLVAAMVKQADVVVLGAIRGPLEVGHYRLALQALAPFSAATESIRSVVYPQLSRLIAGRDGRAARGLVGHATARYGLPLAFASAVGIVIAPLVVAPVMGEEYGAAAPVVQWLLAASAIAAGCVMVKPLLLSLRRLRALLVMSTVGGAATLVAAVVGAHLAGSAGVAAARFFVAALAANVAFLFYLRRPWRKLLDAHPVHAAEGAVA